MGIWGKVIGGVTGFALGGPLGSMLGAVAGHAVDKMREEDGGSGFDDGAAHELGSQPGSVAVALVVLSAKLAKVDGRVTREEIDAFKTLFRVPQREMRQVGRLFDVAKRDSDGFEAYARQVARLYGGNRRRLEEVLETLFRLACADKAITTQEVGYLAEVARIFGLDSATFDRLRSSFGKAGPADTDPYAVLGVTRHDDDDSIKVVYRQLMRDNHPDSLAAKGLPSSDIAAATERVASINAAYDRIRKDRGRKQQGRNRS